jgi:serine protease
MMRAARTLLAPLVLLATVGLPPQAGAASGNPDPVAAPVSGAAPGRVIVALKRDGALLATDRRPLAADDPRRQAERLQARADALAHGAGVALRSGRSLGERQQVLHAGGLTSEALAARLAALPEVEWAVPDRRRRAFFVPSDPLYGQAPRPLGPDAGQWYLRPPDALFRSAADFEGAWDLRRGDTGMVVAVVDTGVRPDHPDLNGVLLPGIDTVDDPSIANDGDGADGDASDPGDWVSDAESRARPGLFPAECIAPSSWHGTQVSTIVAAVAGEGVGMAGAAHGVRVLPVRVLGKCGGYDSDIIAGMLWAAGLERVAGIWNPGSSRAQVINVSLGGGGACTQAYIDAIGRIVDAGVVVVAAAGNGVGMAVGSPANCPGVVGVGGLRHVGSKVGFSDLGSELAISAPGGNCVNIDPGAACLYPILAGTNRGSQAPEAGGSTWTDSVDISVGTSFATPLVSAAAALVRLHRPALLPAEVRQVLQLSARPFPQDGADNGPDDPTPVGACLPPGSEEQLQCYCPNPATDGVSLCGSGMLDVPAALRASTGAFARIAVAPSIAVVGQPLRLDASGSLPSVGGAVVGHAWTIVDGGSGAARFEGSTDGAAADLVPTRAGTVVVALTLADDLGAQSNARVELAVAPADDGGDQGSRGGGALGAGWLLALGVAVSTLRRVRSSRD